MKCVCDTSPLIFLAKLNLLKLLEDDEVINAAKEMGIDTVLIDDKRARSLARSVGMTTCGTLWVLLRAVKREEIKKEKAYEIICDLPRYGFRIDAEFLLQIAKKLK